MYLFSELNILPALLLLALWTLGGWLITARTFDLPAHERILVGLGVGLVTGTWLANWLARFVGPDLAFWGAALLTIALGLAMSWPLNRSLFTGSPNSEWKVPTHRANVSSVKQPGGRVFQPGGLLLFLFFVFVFTLIGRGFGFFDDHQNLAPVSIMATGDIPPHFSYNPDLRFGYHYFLLLVASQFVRLAAAGPWTALDLARGLTPDPDVDLRRFCGRAHHQKQAGRGGLDGLHGLRGRRALAVFPAAARPAAPAFLQHHADRLGRGYRPQPDHRHL